MIDPILCLENLSKFYINGQNVVTGLDKVNLSLYPGEFVAVTGESGSGKSTLAHILGGILPYEDGEMYVQGMPTSHYDRADWESYRREKVSFISQSYEILHGATVMDHVVSALLLTGLDRAGAEAKAREILEEVELWDLKDRRAAKLSSGQKQRLSIARALAKPCPILIADEPTGNLDPENSIKVIRLLAQAAQERLVILITHEFSEAEDYVTRHISLQDGHIVSDSQLRPAAELIEMPTTQNTPRKLGRYFTGLQLRSRPVWSAMVLLFFVLTAFSVFAFLGSFIVALDDTSTRVYQTDAFLDGTKTRIVAVRKDQQPMTQEDYETILSIKYVESLERYGYAADICYAWQENVDYGYVYNVRDYGNPTSPMYIDTVTVQIPYTGQFVRTVPMLAQDEAFLSAGRLPQRFDEVVAADADLLGQTVTVYLKDFRNWTSGAYIKLEATVVGVAKQGRGLYFSDDVAKVLSLEYLGSSYVMMPCYDDVPSRVTYTDYRDWADVSRVGVNNCPPFLTECLPTADSVMRPLTEDEMLISFPAYANLRVIIGSGTQDLSDAVWFLENFDLWLTIMGIHESTLESIYAVSPDTFDTWLADNSPSMDQVSITIRDYAYTDRVISALEKAGYYALSPYVLGSATVNSELASQRVQTLMVCLGALAAVILLQIIVIRAMFGMELDSYRILSTVGLPYRTAKTSILMQVLIFTALGQLLGLGGIFMCSFLGVANVADLTRYLHEGYWVMLSLVHLVSALAAAAAVLGSLRKQVYPQSQHHSDLDWEVTE